MNIGIDATVVAQSHIVGISRFITQLVLSLAQVDSTNDYYLCYRARALKRPYLIWRPHHPRFRVRFFQGALNRRLFRKLDVFHATYQRLPAHEGLVPYICTLYDIFFLSRRDLVSPKAHERWGARYRDVAARSQLIMTVSEFSKGEIVRLLAVDPQRVQVVPLAASPNYTPQEARVVARIRERYGFAHPYILFGGGSDPRKNVLGALRAFAIARPRLPAELQLAIAGTPGASEDAAQAFVSESGLSTQVRFLGFVPEADYPGLMSGSLLYFFPSLFEGFGLPALEAMACGAPVVASATTSLPEVCGDAALLVDPADPAQMADALVELAGNATLRHELGQRGLRRARQSTWRQVAERTLELYNRVATG